MAKKVQRSKPKPKKQKKQRQITKPNARQRKKQEKQSLQIKYESKAEKKTRKLTYAELKQIERHENLKARFPNAPDQSFEALSKREEKADRQKRQRKDRYQKNLKLVAESGVDLNITEYMSTKQVKERIEQEKKIKVLLGKGLSRKDAEEFKNASWKDIYDIANITYTTDKWIGVSWWDSTGESDMRAVLHEIQGMTLDEKISQIHKFYEEAKDSPDDSNAFRGVAMFVHGNSKEYVQNRMNDFKKRGYAWSVPYNYVNIGISNEFSTEGVVDMLYLAMARTSNVHRERFYDEVRYFMKQNAPEIYKRIF